MTASSNEHSVCEVCGKPAKVRTIHRVVQDAPTRDESGRWWRKIHLEGGYHDRCAEHEHDVEYRDTDEFRAWLREHPVEGGAA